MSSSLSMMSPSMNARGSGQFHGSRSLAPRRLSRSRSDQPGVNKARVLIKSPPTTQETWMGLKSGESRLKLCWRIWWSVAVHQLRENDLCTSSALHVRSLRASSARSSPTLLSSTRPCVLLLSTEQRRSAYSAAKGWNYKSIKGESKLWCAKRHHFNVYI